MDSHSSIPAPKATLNEPPTERPDPPHVGAWLRRWRKTRGISQLALSLEAEVSMRHLSCVETGRSRPSKELVLRLADVLHVPLRERNLLLVAAGYAPAYRETGLDAPELSRAWQAVELLLAQHEPHPTIVLDRHWNLLKANAGTLRFLALFLPPCSGPGPRNALRLMFDPAGLRPFVENWNEVAQSLIQRAHREVADNPSDVGAKALLDELVGYPGVPPQWRVADLERAPAPLLVTSYRHNGTSLRLFSTITTFGTPQDVTMQELRIESFFPADDATRQALAVPAASL